MTVPIVFVFFVVVLVIIRLLISKNANCEKILLIDASIDKVWKKNQLVGS